MKKKLKQLSNIEGMSVMAMLRQATFDGVSQGICMNDGCSFTKEVEPDCDQGYCEDCKTNTVSSAAVLGGII